VRRAFLLFKLSFRRARLLLGATGVLLAFFQMFRILVASEVHRSGQFQQISALIPPFIRDIIGPSFTSFLTFHGLVCAVYADTAFIIIFVALAITIGTLPASEIESGFADLVLARPVPRHWLITRTIALIIVTVVLMHLMIILGTLAGLAAFTPRDAVWPSARIIGSLALNLALLALAWSGVALAFGAACRRGVAASATSLIAFAALIVDWGHRVWAPLGHVVWLSPFYYFEPYELVAGTPLRWSKLLVLAGIALAGWLAAYGIIQRRDIAR